MEMIPTRLLITDIKDNINKLNKVKASMQKDLEQIFVTLEKNNVKIVMRGDKHLEHVIINGEENKNVKELINDAMKEADKKAEKKARSYASDLGLSL